MLPPVEIARSTLVPHHLEKEQETQCIVGKKWG